MALMMNKDGNMNRVKVVCYGYLIEMDEDMVKLNLKKNGHVQAMIALSKTAEKVSGYEKYVIEQTISKHARSVIALNRRIRRTNRIIEKV